MEQFSNFVNITLASACGPGDATVVVNSGVGLPATGTFSGLLEAEIVCCTARAGTTLSLLRGQEGTVAASHALGVEFKNIVSARSIAQLKADILGAIGATPPILFSVGLVTISSTDTIPAGATITRVCVLTSVQYTTGALIAVGQAGDAGLLVPPTGVGSFNPAVPAPSFNDFPMLTPWGGTTGPVLVTLGGTAASVGACTVFVEYALPGD